MTTADRAFFPDDPELRALVAILGACCGLPAELDPGFGEDRLELLAWRHRVLMPAVAGWTALAAAGRGPPVPEKLLKLGRREHGRAFQSAAWLARLGNGFDAAGIDWIALKGPALSQQVYGDPYRRTARDLDVLVRPAAMPRAVEVARALGWTVEEEWQSVMRLTGKVDLELASTHPDQPLLEIHDRISPDHAPVRFGAIGEFATVAVNIGLRDVPALQGEEMIVYIAWHGAKQLWARLNWLLDLAGLLQREPHDPVRLIECARRSGAERSLRAGLILCEQLFGVTIQGIPTATPALQRSSERIAQWAVARIELGAHIGAVGPRPGSYRWHWREAMVNDRQSSLASKLHSLMIPIGPDVRLLGPQRPAILHYLARPFLLGRRIVMDVLGRQQAI